MIQTIEEVKRVVSDWGHQFCPSDMVHNQKNAELLTEYCITQFGTITAGGLTHAYNALRDKLDLIAPPPSAPKLSTDELAAQEIARQHADYMKSIAPQPNFQDRVKAETVKREAEKNAKIQADSKAALGQAILNYQCYRENGSGADVTTTEMVQKDLRTLAVRDAKGNIDYALTIAAVRVVIQEIPDHPKVGDVTRVVNAIRSRNQKK
jgi:hypothetical protein